MGYIRKNRVGYEKPKVVTYGELREPGCVVQALPPVNSIIRLYRTIFTIRDKVLCGSYGREHSTPAEGCLTGAGKERFWQVVGYTRGIEYPKLSNNHMLVKCINPEVMGNIQQSYSVIQISYGILRVKVDGYVDEDGCIVEVDKSFYE